MLGTPVSSLAINVMTDLVEEKMLCVREIAKMSLGGRFNQAAYEDINGYAMSIDASHECLRGGLVSGNFAQEIDCEKASMAEISKQAEEYYESAQRKRKEQDFLGATDDTLSYMVLKNKLNERCQKHCQNRII
jgi:hypothetical protein